MVVEQEAELLQVVAGEQVGPLTNACSARRKWSTLAS